jgi:hypothetical protein
MKPIPPGYCYCGRPLHYDDPHVLAFYRRPSAEIRAFVDACIEDAGGECAAVTMPDGRAFLVPRHYIALHGITGATDLAALGFDEII